MEKVLIFAICVTVLYCFVKFLEMKYIESEIKPLKEFVRDALIVMVSSGCSAFGLLYFDKYITDLFAIVTDTKVLNMDATEIFTGPPGF
jgi:hypothetical protein